jgi:hypothetical protein
MSCDLGSNEGSSFTQQGETGQVVVVEHAADSAATFGLAVLGSGLPVGVHEAVELRFKTCLKVGACDFAFERVECCLGLVFHRDAIHRGNPGPLSSWNVPNGFNVTARNQSTREAVQTVHPTSEPPQVRSF